MKWLHILSILLSTRRWVVSFYSYRTWRTLDAFFHSGLTKMDSEIVTRKRNLLVDALVVLFGIGSWTAVTAGYIQVPLIVQSAPEGWTLPSQMSFVVQSASIASLIYVVVQHSLPRKFNVAPLIYGTMILGCFATICMSFTYKHTMVIAGNAHSVAWLVNMFLFALVGCLSSVVFMPFMGRFREIYLITYVFGQGFSGIPPSLLAFVQGIGGPTKCVPSNSTDGLASVPEQPEPLFGPNVFFLIIFVIMIGSTVAFYLLNNLNMCKNELAIGDGLNGNDYSYDTVEKERESDDPIPDDVKNLTTGNYVFLLSAECALNCIGNGLFPGLQIFTSLPYGEWTYHLTVNLAAMANPLACYVAMIVPRTSIRNIRILATCLTIIAVYIMFIALSSPHPPLIDSIFGPVLIVSEILLKRMVLWLILNEIVSLL